HDLVRELLDTDLRWRDPDGYTTMHNRIYTHLADTIRTTTDTDVLPAVASLLYLHRNHHTPTHHHHQEGHQEGQFQEDTLHPHDLGTLLRLATTAEGPASARTAAHWAAHHPEAFRLYRRTETGELVAFSTWLRLTEPDDHHLTADPIVAAAWTHARATTPLRAGEHLAISRLWVLPQHRDTSPVLDLIQSRIIGNCLRAERMAWSYIAIRRPNRAWTEHLQRYGMRTIPAQPRLDNTPYTLFVHDWRAVPAHTWLDRMNRLLLGRTTDTPDPTTSDLAVLSQTEFTEAVRKALRQLPRPGALATSPLARTRLIADQAPQDPGTALSDLLRQAIDDLREDPRSAKLHRALSITFLHGTPTQELAAEQLGLPFTTYRRHLTTGIERICTDLWHRELHGADVPAHQST
ncbi:hypothetical protein ABT362_47400, partial [Nonomuraea rubra]